jgi:hypothetical protein
MDESDKEEISRDCYYDEGTNETICNVEYSDGSKEKIVSKGKSLAAGMTAEHSSQSDKLKKKDEDSDEITEEEN